MSDARTPTPIDAVADDYLTKLAALWPCLSTDLGFPGLDDQLDINSPQRHQDSADLAAATLRELSTLTPADDVDRITLAAMRERLGLELELHEAGEYRRDLNNLASPLQALRSSFDMMPTTTPADWEVVAARMGHFDEAIDGYIESLREGIAHAQVPAARQVEIGAKQADDLADPSGSFFTELVGRAAASGIDGGLIKQLEAGAGQARHAYARLASFLRGELAPHAPAADAVGQERYQLWSRYFLGAQVDLRETYQWGLEELDRVIAEQEAVAAQLCGPGASVEQAVAMLDADPGRMLHGTAALRDWMQATADQAIADLAGTQFDIPGPVRRIECMIAPTHDGGIYYTSPSEDFSRPGRMWWSVPEGVTQFGTWREKTTVYHEGVPGHHLQSAQTMYRAGLLNKWRRMGCWVSGHGEGWALYAERLMADLGYLDEPGDRLGMLDGQRMRAARVVLDIGVHLGLPCPQRWGGGTWDADKAWEFFRANVNMDEAFLRFEVDRYLGWPGQAPSYKVGQRLWEQARDEARARAMAAGQEFSLKDFHRRALDIGSVGLDTLREALAL